MSLLFFAMSLASAWLTYNVFRPRYRGRRQVLSFFLGWLWGELAIHVIVVQAVLAAGFALAGATDGALGNLALIILAASCGALGYSYSESESAGPTMENALRVGLGEDYEGAVLSDIRASFEREPRWRELVRPFHMRRPEVERIVGVRFDRQRGIDLELDLYRHRATPQNCPILLQIHGGGWAIGDKKEQALPLMYQMAARGWVCISANYRLSPHATFPEHLIDVKKALAWVREHAAEYGANPDFVVATGNSAGGHLVSLLALTPGDPMYQPGFEDVDTSVSACVPIYGVYDWTDRFGLWRGKHLQEFLEKKIVKASLEEAPDLYRRGSPLDCIAGEPPPFCVVHGDKDGLVPVEEARHFAEMLRAASPKARVVYAEIPGAQHAFEIFKSLRTQMVVDGIERFLGYVYSDYLRATRAASEAQHDEPGIDDRKPIATSVRSNGRFAEQA
jgi:acetyl esterase/lipase